MTFLRPCHSSPAARNSTRSGAAYSAIAVSGVYDLGFLPWCYVQPKVQARWEQVARLSAAGGFLHVDAPNGTPDRPLPDADRLLVQAQPGAVPASGHEVGVHLACAVAPLLRPGMGTALLTGGATAEAVLRHRAVPYLTIRGECLPGLVASDAGGLTIVTKSGGFGTDDSLIRLAGLIGKEG